MKAENLRNPKMSLLVPIAASKPELLNYKPLNIIGPFYLIAAVSILASADSFVNHLLITNGVAT